MKLLALGLAALFALLPAAGLANQPTVEDLVRWAGCQANVVTSDQEMYYSSQYNPSTHTLYIGLQGDIPEDYLIAVTFHEIAHCLQDMEGAFRFPYRQIDLELDADTRSAGLLCAYHKDGPSIVHDLFVHLYKTYGYDGDPTHGTIYERIRAAALAPACQHRTVQAP
jgi:hypothetical protein